MSDSHDHAHDLTRRSFLSKLAVMGVSAPFVAHAMAQMNHDHDHDASHDHDAMHGEMHGGMMASSAIGPDLLPADSIPWGEATCAFCGMTIATPEGGNLPAGFRERTYGQIRLEGGETLHFESLACMANHAYAINVRDGHGATLYVADEGAANTPDHGLLAARDATFLWAEGLQVSMMAKLAAYPNEAAAMAAMGRLEAPGRHYLMDASMLYDLAPVPEMNLIPLLARASGLVD